jgi:two-component system KDP operon response regulator KdpE
MNAKILLVDDESALIRSLQPVLTAQGYFVDSAGTAAEALKKAKDTVFDIILLDLGLPDADGKEIIAKLLDFNALSILVLSARHQEAEKVAALDQGADDFINKPFNIEELLARIRAAVRRLKNEAVKSQEFQAGQLSIDFLKRKVVLMDQEIKFSPKEFDLLETLARHAGQVVTHRQLLLAGWNDPNVDTQYLRSYMALIRQKLEVDSSQPEYLLTEPGVGYRLDIESEH